MIERVLITGSTRGIGEAIAKKFWGKGAYVVGTGTKDVNPNYLDDYLQVDFSRQEDLEIFCEQIKKYKFNVLINNAGINIINDFCDISPEDFLKIQQVNLYAPFRISQACIPNMIDQGWGRIVNISSVWGKISKQGRASYSASKFGIDGMTVAMASEFASQGILCNSIAPGFIDTEMTWNNLGSDGVNKILENVPIKRLAKVDEIADVAYMLGSKLNTYISGQNIAVDGGFTRA